ncbi:MAG: sodium:proton antiporter [Desulfomicrobium escambiense]|nr:sodium:proton antiporter [Desulfomicrobium escambiense]
MVPALDWLELNARNPGYLRAGPVITGAQESSFILDNAPTYLNFLSASFGLHGLSVDNPMHMQAMLGMLSSPQIDHLQFLQASHLKPLTMESWKYIQAISAAAVMFGAMTYIRKRPKFHGQIHCRASEGEDAALYGIHLFLFDPRADTPSFGYLVYILQISLVSKLFSRQDPEYRYLLILPSGFIKNPTAGMDFMLLLRDKGRAG